MTGVLENRSLVSLIRLPSLSPSFTSTPFLLRLLIRLSLKTNIISKLPRRIPLLLLFILFLIAMVGKRLQKAPTNASTTSSHDSTNAPATFYDGLALPKLIVFDLDYTLWPFWVDTHVTPPIKATPQNDACKDRFGESFAFYVEVPSILSSLREKNIKVGAASRTSAPDLAREMLRLLHIVDVDGKKKKAIDFFDQLEIYPGNKITHFNKLQKATGLRYEDMLFFDDEARNRNVETLGVTMYLVRDGVSRAEINNGIKEWRKKHGHDTGKAGSSGQ